MKQFETSKKEYISKLKAELDTVEARFLKVINENNMVGEDFRSAAFINYHRYIAFKLKYNDTVDDMAHLKKQNKHYAKENKRVLRMYEMLEMELEDKHSNIMRDEDIIMRLKFERKTLRDRVQDLDKRVTKEKAAVKRFHEEVNKLNEQIETLEGEKEFMGLEIQELKGDLDREKSKARAKIEAKKV